MMSDLMREEFEKVAAEKFEVDVSVLRNARTDEDFDGFPYRVVNQHGDSSEHVNSLLGVALMFWQASRESLVVELPTAFWPGYLEEVDGETIADDLFTKSQVIEAIHAAGVKTK